MRTCVKPLPKSEYSHHNQLYSLSGGLKLRNLMLATRNGLRLGSIKAPRKRSLAVSTFLAVASSSRGEIARRRAGRIRSSRVPNIHVANKKAISHPLLNEGTFIREYSKFRPIEYISFKSFQCLLESSLIVEYSRMKVPSLSSGCEIAFLFAIPVPM
jgi:hypothetical protein